MKVSDAEMEEIRLKLQVALEKLEEVCEDLERWRANPDDLLKPVARVVLFLGRCVLATQR